MAALTKMVCKGELETVIVYFDINIIAFPNCALLFRECVGFCEQASVDLSGTTTCHVTQPILQQQAQLLLRLSAWQLGHSLLDARVLFTRLVRISATVPLQSSTTSSLHKYGKSPVPIHNSSA